jgi:hypothetical protein
MILNDLRFDFHGHFENQISNQIPIFQYDFKTAKSSQNYLKSDFVKSSIKSLNTLVVTTQNLLITVTNLELGTGTRFPSIAVRTLLADLNSVYLETFDEMSSSTMAPREKSKRGLRSRLKRREAERTREAVQGGGGGREHGGVGGTENLILY